MNEHIEIKKMSKSIPFRLKIARMGRGYKNRTVFAMHCGAPITTYRAHERGDYELKASDIIRYALALDISIPWLLTGRGHPLDHQARPDSYALAQFLYYIRLESSIPVLKESASKEAATLLDKK